MQCGFDHTNERVSCRKSFAVRLISRKSPKRERDTKFVETPHFYLDVHPLGDIVNCTNGNKTDILFTC